jgi:hypothetical protein
MVISCQQTICTVIYSQSWSYPSLLDFSQCYKEQQRLVLKTQILHTHMYKFLTNYEPNPFTCLCVEAFSSSYKLKKHMLPLKLIVVLNLFFSASLFRHILSTH